MSNVFRVSPNPHISGVLMIQPSPALKTITTSSAINSATMKTEVPPYLVPYHFPSLDCSIQ